MRDISLILFYESFAWRRDKKVEAGALLFRESEKKEGSVRDFGEPFVLAFDFHLHPRLLTLRVSGVDRNEICGGDDGKRPKIESNQIDYGID